MIGTLTGARRPAAPANPALLNKIKSDGIVCLTLSPDEIEQVRAVTNPGFAKLDERRAGIPPEKRKFDDNVYWCTRSADPEAFATVEKIFGRYGIIEAASAYLGRPVGVKHVNAQINDQELAFWKRVFPDTQLADPWGSYLHIDATYGMLKCAIYVHDIGPDGGPFCYVRGSQNAKIGWFEGMVRRTNDFCGFSGRKPDARRKFMALPAFLRKKADFGGDLPDDSAEVQRLREGHFAQPRTTAIACCSTATACIAAAWSTRASAAVFSFCLRKSDPRRRRRQAIRMNRRQSPNPARRVEIVRQLVGTEERSLAAQCAVLADKGEIDLRQRAVERAHMAFQHVIDRKAGVVAEAHDIGELRNAAPQRHHRGLQHQQINLLIRFRGP